MMEFVRNCYTWVAENYKEITMTLTSAQFISIISAIVIFLKNIKSSKDNTAATKALNSTMENTNAMSESISELKNELETVKIENKALVEGLRETLEYLNTHSAKLNTMLDVQSVVYSTIKDDKIRNTVNSLLVNARYSESTSRAKLQKEVESLRAKVAEKMNDVQNIVDSTADVVKGIVDLKSQSHIPNDDTIMRY